MFPKSSRRAFLKHASSLAIVSGLTPNMSLKGLAQSADRDLDELAKALQTKALGQVLRPGHAEYSRIKYYNARFDCVRTGAYLRPATTQGVQKIVSWANRYSRNLAIRGGGHSFEGKSNHRELVVDMSRLARHKFMGEGTLEVEAGVLLGDVYNTLGAAGHILPAGTCPSIGIVGHALGGGIGDFLPMFGYTAQSLREATLVTMGGAILKVNDEAVTFLGGTPLTGNDLRARDLMTVLRGGGQGSVGIVTNMTFQTYDLSSTKLASFRLESDDGVSHRNAVKIIRSWQAWREALPKPMQEMVSSKLNLSRSGNRYDFEIAGLIAIAGESGINVSDVRRTLNALFRIPELPNRSFSKSLTAAGAIKTFLDDDETTQNRRRAMLYGSSSVLPYALPKKAVETLIQNLQNNIFASFYTSGGKSKTAMATSLHPSEFLIEWTSYSARADRDGHRNIRALSAKVMKTAGFQDLASPNYPDDELRNYFPNSSQVEFLRKSLDPGSLSTSSLLAPKPRGLSDGECR